MTQDLVLVMKYHPKSGNWAIHTPAGVYGPLIQYPPTERIEELWAEQVPGKGGPWCGTGTTEPVKGLLIEVEKGTTPKERGKFLAALQSECRVVAHEPC